MPGILRLCQLVVTLALVEGPNKAQYQNVEQRNNITADELACFTKFLNIFITCGFQGDLKVRCTMGKA